jgi:GNAT superfamily N-acetyltransferase
VRIRWAENRDIDELVEMAFEFENDLLKIDDALIQESPSRETFKDILLKGFEDDKHAILIAEEDEKAVGFLDFWAYPEFLHGGVSGYMNNVFVREGYRGKGIGTSLFNKALEEAKKRGIVAMHIPVKAKNLRALEFYKKNKIDERLFMLETRLDR